MSYQKMTIKEVLDKIGNNEMYLPAIQRKFVWKQDQIEKLFDSIQQGYPIGTFLFWFLNKPHINEYVFYKFLQNYHERDKYLNDKAPYPELKDQIIGVLDGQQRLSSIYLALQGTYSVRKRRAKWSSDSSFPEKTLFLNLLSDVHTDEDNELNYSFQFITKDEASNSGQDKLWFPVREVLTWEKDSPPIDEKYDELLTHNMENVDVTSALKESSVRNRIKRTLRDLHSRIVRDELINYFKIEEQDLDNILKIFVRVNSGGTTLSKTDLLFSTIVANWEDGRDEIEKFITSINKKGDDFSFNNDFVMRSCLMLTDCSVIFKVGSFKTENVTKIKTEWQKIKNAISTTIDLLVEYGLSGSNLTSQNAIIPIAYYIIKGGVLNPQTKNDIKKFLFHSLLKNVFGGQGDTVLTNFRNSLAQKDESTNDYILKSHEFSFAEISETKLPSNRSLKVTDEDIDEFLDYKKGNYAFLILSFLYPNLKYGHVKFHQDHIHPVSQFTDAQLNANNINVDKHRVFQELKDKLPNLQLMEGLENITKNDTPFQDWLSDQPDKDKFLTDNYIDINQSLEFKDFEDFFEKRRNKLKTALQNLLK
ncbi:hypothetical protein B6N60_02959 [Richelia sinica FACHB-800]|uniref:GmrSD restriction endonucleases N-terminal domain-containing protein n=1 Tax=Richelia sinica FACHB-800 TaxID=1357546 RepID=A0A975Y5H9_9NOST|nr:DUF262 domain-containing protein [Richelia sinica]MBD2666746.1 DUF262 domain-containing protein [Richelia sinica FACHB-800]QXE24255.1 hypothetical protein B6N60_02959 [Richelia sinica FACHB-800]